MHKLFKMMSVAVFAMMPMMAHAADVTGRVDVSNRVILKADDYVWQDIKSSDPVSVDVNLQTQMAYVYKGETLIGVSSISSGKAGFETPMGDYKVLWKEENHFSKKYKADMPFTMWITMDGIALHAGRIPGRAASHGCVRLPIAFAEKLFSVVNKTTTVAVYQESPVERMSLETFLASR